MRLRWRRGRAQPDDPRQAPDDPAPDDEPEPVEQPAQDDESPPADEPAPADDLAGLAPDDEPDEPDELDELDEPDEPHEPDEPDEPHELEPAQRPAPADEPVTDAAARGAPAGRGGGRHARRRAPRQDRFRRIRGRRSARLVADRRRRRRRRRVLAGSLVVAVAATAGLAVWWLRPDPPSAPAPSPTDDGPVVEAGYTLLLARVDEDSASARSVTLLAGGDEDGPGLVLFLPVGALVDIPGVGTDRLGLAYRYGGAGLLQSTVENALGVAVEHTAVASDQALGAFLDRLEGLEVVVEERLVDRRDDGSADVRFEQGRQFLDGARLAEYWGFRQRGEDELDALPRQQRVLEGLLEATADEETRAALVDDGAPQLDTTAEAAWLGELLERLAAARAEERLRFALLPVEPFGGAGPDGEATYRVRRDALAELADGVLAAAVPGGVGDVVRVQVLNGVGVPGVGSMVDDRLDRGLFRIVVTDNARHFDFRETQILVYAEDGATLEAAERVRSQLGVGSIQVSRQPQSVVDLTIVVGADFLERDPSPSEGQAANP